MGEGGGETEVFIHATKGVTKAFVTDGPLENWWGGGGVVVWAKSKKKKKLRQAKTKGKKSEQFLAT